MTTEELDKRIKRLEQEGQILIQSHQTTVRKFDQIISQNQSRFHQIKGGIAELQALKEKLNDNTNGGTQPALAADRFPDPGNRDSRDRGLNVAY